MSTDQSEQGQPLPEEYSRVTDPERFAPLHDVAVELIDRLNSVFDVELAEGYGLDSELEGHYGVARPSVKLMPRNVDSASVVIVFSEFPGLHIRFGRWSTAAFPSCGCDACSKHETPEGEIERLKSMVDDVTAGRFRETIRIPEHGEACAVAEFWSEKGGSSGGGRIDRQEAEQLVSGGRSSYEWLAWAARKREFSGGHNK